MIINYVIIKVKILLNAYANLKTVQGLLGYPEPFYSIKRWIKLKTHQKII